MSVLALILVSQSASHSCQCVAEPGGFLYRDGVTVPANSVGIPWSGRVWPLDDAGLDALAEFIAVQRMTTSGPLSVNFKLSLLPPSDLHPTVVLVAPSNGWEGKRYRFVYERARALGTYYRDHSGPETEVIDITVSSEPLVLSEEPLSVLVSELKRGDVSVETGCGNCGNEIDAAYRDLVVSLPDGLKRWEEVLFYSTRIGDQWWRPKTSNCSSVPPGTSWAGRGKERFVTECGVQWSTCAPLESLTPGRHVAEIGIWLPGTELRSATEVEIDLSCASSAVEMRPCNRAERKLISAALAHALLAPVDMPYLDRLKATHPTLVKDQVSGLRCALDQEVLPDPKDEYRLVDPDEAYGMAKQQGSVDYFAVADAWGLDDSRAEVHFGTRRVVFGDGTWQSGWCLMGAEFEIRNQEWAFNRWTTRGCECTLIR